jgi:hypothetical protein
MTDDVSFAKIRFATALAGFGSGLGRGRREAAERSDKVADKSVDIAVDDQPRAKKSSANTSVETRRKAEKVAAKTGRKGGKARKSATVGLRCTTRQKMILLALQEHLELDTISDAAVYAILKVAAEHAIHGAEEGFVAIEKEHAGE